MSLFRRIRICSLLSVFLVVGTFTGVRAQETATPSKTVLIPITRSNESGLFFVKGKVNSIEGVNFLVDTGATWVSLTKKTAIALGIYDTTPEKSISAFTASGSVRVFFYRIDQITVGDITVKNVLVTVVPSSPLNLLGNSFLTKLKSFTFENGVLTLEQ